MTDYFRLLGLKAQYRIDEKKLQTNYTLLQQQFHPDNYVTQGEQQRRLAQQISVRVNRARDTLLQPIQRATHLLSLSGHDDITLPVDNDFLQQQMELNEKLEQMSNSPSAVKKTILQQQQEVEKKLGDILNGTQLDTEQATAAQQCIDRLRFYSRLLERIEEKA